MRVSVTSEPSPQISDSPIQAFVSIVCDTRPPFTYQKSFPLPRRLFQAALSLYKHLGAHEIYGIDTDRCERTVKLIVSRGTELKAGFALLVKHLKKRGIRVEVVRK